MGSGKDENLNGGNINNNDDIVIEQLREDLITQFEQTGEYLSLKSKTEDGVYSKLVVSAITTALSMGLSEKEFLTSISKKRTGQGISIKDYMKTQNVDMSTVKISKFSRSEQKQRDEISKIAEINFAMAYYDAEITSNTLNKALKNLEITEDERHELAISRDIMTIMFKPGNSESTYRQNVSTAKYLLGQDIDKTKISVEELKDIKSRRYAEVLNRRMTEILSIDYDQFKHMSDDQLAKRWREYYQAMHSISIIKIDVKNISKENPYVDKQLFERALDLESEMGMYYYTDSGRIQMILSPYYASNDIDTLGMIEDHNLDFSNNPEVRVFIGGDAIVNSGASTALLEHFTSIYQELREDIQTGDLKFFNKDGEEIFSLDFQRTAASGSPIIVAPKGHPELVKAFNIDTKTFKDEVADPQIYAEVIETIKAGMTDDTVAEKANDQVALNSSKTLKNRNNSVKTLGELTASIADDILKSDDPDISLAAIENYAKRNINTVSPKLSYKKFVEFLGIKNEGMISKAAMKARRDLSRGAFNSVLEAEVARQSGIAFPEEIKQMIRSSGMNEAAFMAVMCKPGTDNLEANKQMVRDFFGYDQDNQKLNLTSEQLTQKRNELIQSRLNELAEVHRSIGTKALSDEKIVESYSKIAQLQNSVGKEWGHFTKGLAENLGHTMDNDLLNQGNELGENANRLNDIYGSRMDYISSAYYQYGGEKELTSESGAMLAMGSNDHELRVTGLSVTRHAVQYNRGISDEVLMSAGINPRDVDFAYDQNGKSYEGDKISLGEAFKNSASVMVFKKGQSVPVMLNIADLKKRPAEATLAEPTEGDLVRAKMARFDMKLSRIDNDYALSKYEKSVQTAMVENEYELGIIAGSLKGLSGDKLELYKDSLKDSLANYLARVTADRYMKANTNASERIADEKHIASYMKAIRKTESLSQLVDTMLTQDGAFENIDSEKIFNEFSKLQKEFAAKELAQRKEIEKNEYLESSRKAAETAKAVADIQGSNDLSFWSISSETAAQVATLSNGTDVGNLSVTRGALQAVSFGVMMSKKDQNGNPLYTVDQIFSSSPEMVAARAECSKEAVNLVIGNERDQIAAHLMGGLKGLNQYLYNYTDQMKDFNNVDLFKEEFRAPMKACTVMKDLTQEIKKVYRSYEGLPDNQKPFSAAELDKQHRLGNAMTELFVTSTDGTMQIMGAASGMAKEGLTAKSAFTNNFSTYCSSMVFNSLMKTYTSLPENVGKNPADLMGEEFAQIAENVKQQINQNQDIKDLIKHVGNAKASSSYPAKALISMLDGSLAQNLNLNIQLTPDNPDQKFSFTMDTDAMFRGIKEKAISMPGQPERDPVQEVKAPVDSKDQLEAPNLGSVVPH